MRNERCDKNAMALMFMLAATQQLTRDVGQGVPQANQRGRCSWHGIQKETREEGCRYPLSGMWTIVKMDHKRDRLRVLPSVLAAARFAREIHETRKIVADGISIQ
jgi:hypothetical protein